MPFSPQMRDKLLMASSLLTGQQMPTGVFGQAEQNTLKSMQLKAQIAKMQQEMLESQQKMGFAQDLRDQVSNLTLPDLNIPDQQKELLLALAPESPDKAIDFLMQMNKTPEGTALIENSMFAAQGDPVLAAQIAHKNLTEQKQGDRIILGNTESEQQKARGKALSGFVDNVGARVGVAKKSLSLMETINSFLEGVDTGPITPAVLEISKTMNQLGIDTTGIESLMDSGEIGRAEAGRALVNALTLSFRNPAGGEGMPGQLSNRDVVFLTQMTAGLSTTAEGRKLLLEAQRETVRKSIEANAAVGEAIRQSPTGTITDNFRIDLQNKLAEDVFFTKDGKKTDLALRMEQAMGGEAVPGATPGVNGDLTAEEQRELEMLRQMRAQGQF